MKVKLDDFAIHSNFGKGKTDMSELMGLFRQDSNQKKNFNIRKGMNISEKKEDWNWAWACGLVQNFGSLSLL